MRGKQFVDHIFCDLPFAFKRITPLAAVRMDYCDYIGVNAKPGTFVLQRIYHYHVKILALHLRATVLHLIVGFESEPA